MVTSLLYEEDDSFGYQLGGSHQSTSKQRELAVSSLEGLQQQSVERMKPSLISLFGCRGKIIDHIAAMNIPRKVWGSFFGIPKSLISIYNPGIVLVFFQYFSRDLDVYRIVSRQTTPIGLAIQFPLKFSFPLSRLGISRPPNFIFEFCFVAVNCHIVSPKAARILLYVSIAGFILFLIQHLFKLTTHSRATPHSPP